MNKRMNKFVEMKQTKQAETIYNMYRFLLWSCKVHTIFIELCLLNINYINSYRFVYSYELQFFSLLLWIEMII